MLAFDHVKQSILAGIIYSLVNESLFFDLQNFWSVLFLLTIVFFNTKFYKPGRIWTFSASFSCPASIYRAAVTWL